VEKFKHVVNADVNLNIFKPSSEFVWNPYSTWKLKLSHSNTEASSTNFHINTLIGAYSVAGRWAGRREKRLILFGLNLEQVLCNKSRLWALFALDDVAISISPRTLSHGVSCHTLSHKLYLQPHTTFLKDPAKHTARHLDCYLSTPTVKTIFTSLHKSIRSRYRVVGIATGYGLDAQGIWVLDPMRARIFSSPHRPDRLWGPTDLLSNGHRGYFPGSKAARAWSWPHTSS
jgi:hypothetical protein